MIDVPNCQRCCFCLPLRRGVITFGYMNIIWSTLIILTALNSSQRDVVLYHGFFANLSKNWIIAFNAMDILASLVLVVGGHSKWIPGLQVFYYYSWTTLLPLFILQIFEFQTVYLFILILQIGMFILSTLIHVYLLLQVNSLIKKLEFETSEAGYENKMNDLGTTEEGNTEKPSISS